MATVWKHPNSSFWTAIYLDDRGSWRRKSTKQKDRREALKIAISLEEHAEAIRTGTATFEMFKAEMEAMYTRHLGNKIAETTRQFAQKWLQRKHTQKSEATAITYESVITTFLTFLKDKADQPLRAINTSDCQAYYDFLAEQKLASATLIVRIKTLRAMLNSARRQQLIVANPAESVELPERIRQVRRNTFSDEQVQIIIRHIIATPQIEPEWQTATLLGFYAGLRLSDAISLQWENVDLALKQLQFTSRKTSQDLVIPIHPALDSHLNQIAGDRGGPLCPKLSSVPIPGRSGLSKQFLAIMRQAGLNTDSIKTSGQRNLARLSFHSLRATFNSNLHNRGVSQEIRKKLTGHKSDAVNDRYTQTETATLTEAISKLPSLDK